MYGPQGIDPSTLPEDAQRGRFFMQYIMQLPTRQDRKTYLDARVPEHLRDMVRAMVVSAWSVKKPKPVWRANDGKSREISQES